MYMRLNRNNPISGVRSVKLQLDRIIRLRIIVSLAGILVFSTVFLLSSLLEEKTIEQKVSKVLGNHEGIISYTVNLKPNPIYSGSTQNMDEMYITKMIDGIQTDYVYNFKGNTGGQISVESSISAVIEGFNQNDQNEILWSKSYSLVPKVKKTASGDFTLNSSAKIDLAEYNSFVTEVFEKFKVSSKVNLTINYNISVEVRDKKNIICRDSLSPNLIMPLSVDFFKISGKRKASNELKVSDTRKTVTKNLKSIAIFSAADGICLLLAIFLLAFVASTDKSHRSRMIQGILRKHNNRIVQICDRKYCSIDDGVSVLTFNDLLKVSDELGKPILFNTLNAEGFECFFILDSSGSYIYKIGQV